MKLSIIILNYNVRYFLELCLKSVEAAIKDIDAEIIVVDNNSSDDSCKMIKQLYPSVQLIENKTNLGFSKGNNIGAKKAKGDYLCILNPDTVIAEDTFTKILEFAESKQNSGIIGCQLIDGKGQFLPESKRSVPNPRVALQKFFGYTKNYYDVSLEPNEIGETKILVGAFMILKRHIYNEIKGFDEDYFMYGEDIDLSYRILKLGYHNYYFGDTTIIHYKGESTLKDKVYAKRFYGAMEIFYKKHFKRNLFYTIVVRFAISLALKRNKIVETSKDKKAYTVLLSDTIPEKLRTVFTEKITLISKPSEIQNNTKVVFDTNYSSYKNSIECMKSNTTIKNNSYRILVNNFNSSSEDIKENELKISKRTLKHVTLNYRVKNSNFIIGSDSNINRGEVISF